MAAGHRIPDKFRRRVTERIRMIMREYCKREGTWIHCATTAQDLGLTTNAVWLWWEGRTLPTIYNLVRFADYHEVSVDYILGRTAVKQLVRTGMLKVAA